MWTGSTPWIHWSHCALSKPTSHGEAEAIPHTTVSCNTFVETNLPSIRNVTVLALLLARSPSLEMAMPKAAFPLNILLSVAFSIFVRGDQANVNIEPAVGMEATQRSFTRPRVLVYPTVDDYLGCLP
ncbi:hypothetical protein HU200_020987 [Digitaria exilis]|uniref:Uncharacterized protein n=1 Tax=Digitaria exilis TaxID=1010633 RepID=A0A835K9E0_9POAL|nr:hypothetical protein HU200_020987 [Digitaria exilis]